MGLPGAANSQTTWVLVEAVATEDAVDVPKHVRDLQLLASPHRKSTSGYKRWEAHPAPAAKTHTKTTHPLLHTRLT